MSARARFDLGHGVNDGTHRRLNESLAWRAIEEECLAAHQVCERCNGAPAVEAHNRAGCFSPWRGSYRLEDAQALCSSCHDDVCPTRARTALDVVLDRIL